MVDSRLGGAPFALLGRKLSHSWSPQIHEALGSFPYALVELEPEEFEPFVRGGSWRGLNVTIPYKLKAATLADVLTPAAERVGSANTLVRLEDGSILAENTDALGFSWMLARFCTERLGSTPAEALVNRKVLVLGSGGASQAVVYALESTFRALPVVISRTGEETYATIAERHADAALLVNTTPVGMFPNCPESPLPEERLTRLTELRGVIDLVYNPTRTGIVLAAERRGIPSESGLAMLVAQALYASELFQGKDLEDGLVGTLERQILERTRNIVLIGMPGAGKSSCGRELARLLGRPFVDLDDAVEAESGCSPAHIISERGEEAFRVLETQQARRYGSRSGLVIACGGGVVTRRENYDLLHQNGVIVFLDRPLGELSVAGRPLSRERGVEAVASERMPLYRSWADLVLSTTGSAAGDARALLDALR